MAREQTETAAMPPLSESWRALLMAPLQSAEWAKLERQLAARVAAGAVILPPSAQRFAAFNHCPPQAVKVVIVGQDPYHGVGQAHGLSFSVTAGVAPPPSLRNIFAELVDDLGVARPDSGDLSHWAEQGVLLLNAVLSVEQGEPNSHQGWGWEALTDAALAALSADPAPKVFVLWGNFAGLKKPLIDSTRHLVLSSAHPSPLSARRGFFGSRPFSKANAFLLKHGRDAIDWQLPASQPGLF